MAIISGKAFVGEFLENSYTAGKSIILKFKVDTEEGRQRSLIWEHLNYSLKRLETRHKVRFHRAANQCTVTVTHNANPRLTAQAHNAIIFGLVKPKGPVKNALNKQFIQKKKKGFGLK